MDISIIIPVYQAKDTIKNTINSILKQNLKYINPKIEIILSVDDQKDYKKYLKSEKKNIKIRIIKTKKNGSGPGYARNEAIKNCKGRYVGFLDADDEYSDNYIQEMYKVVKKKQIVIAPTHIFKDNKRIGVYSGKNKNFLRIDDVSNNPCSFHPFLNIKKIKKFELKPSQDIYNLSNFLNENSITIVNKAYYKLNIRDNSYTAVKHFSHNVNLAYKFYQIKSIKDKKYKIAKQFAKRRIINKKYSKWKNISTNKSKHYYEFIKHK